MKKSNLKLYGLLFGLTAALVLMCAFMMPKFPTYTQEPNDVPKTDENTPTFSGDDVPLVVIDPGHGGYDEGGRSADGRIVENVYDLMMANKIKVLLEKEGIQVIMTRTSDEVSWSDRNVEDLQARIDIADNAHADLMVSIHCNSNDEDPLNVTGSEVYVNTKQTGSTSLGESIVEALNDLQPTLTSRGIRHGALHLLTYNSVPTAIVEMAFLSNPNDVEFLCNEDNQNLMCEKIAEGIINELKK